MSDKPATRSQFRVCVVIPAKNLKFLIVLDTKFPMRKTPKHVAMLSPAVKKV